MEFMLFPAHDATSSFPVAFPMIRTSCLPKNTELAYESQRMREMGEVETFSIAIPEYAPGEEPGTTRVLEESAYLQQQAL